MADTYQDSGYEQQYSYEPEPKKKMSGWLIALIVALVLIVLCCLCACVVMLVAGPTVGNTFSTIIEELVTPVP